MKVDEDLAVSPGVSSLMGALAGSVEVIIQQPLVAWKNAVQDARPVPLDPRLLYRGVVVNACSMAPINGLQFGVNRYLEEKVAVDGELSNAARTGTATVAGAVSALVTCPGELLVIQQQKAGTTLSDQCSQIMRQHGTMGYFRGMAPTVVREGIFTGAYLGVIPGLREKLAQAAPGLFEHRPVASLAAASVVAGVAATVLTQPFDTVKTRMQANLSAPAYRTMTGTARAMWHEGGARALFRGFVPRAQRVTFAVFILGEAKERLTDIYLHVEKYRSKGVLLTLETES